MINERNNFLKSLRMSLDSDVFEAYLNTIDLYINLPSEKLYKKNIMILQEIVKKTKSTVSRNCHHEIINNFIKKFCEIQVENTIELNDLKKIILPKDFREVFSDYQQHYFDDGRHQYDNLYLYGLQNIIAYLQNGNMQCFAEAVNDLIGSYYDYYYSERILTENWITNELFGFFNNGDV